METTKAKITYAIYKTKTVIQFTASNGVRIDGIPSNELAGEGEPGYVDFVDVCLKDEITIKGYEEHVVAVKELAVFFNISSEEIIFDEDDETKLIRLNIADVIILAHFKWGLFEIEPMKASVNN